jgi:hypothetical protein
MAIIAVEEGDVDDADAIMRICSHIWTSAVCLDDAALRENVAELLGALGVSAKLADALLDSAGLKLLTWCLRPKVEPFLLKYGLTWEDVLPVLETIDSIGELKKAVQDPLAHLEQAAESSQTLAKKLAVAYLKPPLSPYLAKQGLEWADVVPALETVDSIEELKAAVEDPMKMLEELAEASAPLAKRLAIMYLKPVISPHLRKEGLEWPDVMPALETIDSFEELKDAMKHPMKKLEEMAEASAPLAKKLAVMYLKPPLAPFLSKQGLDWPDVVPVLETVDSIDELKTAVTDTAGFLERLAEQAGPAAKKLAIVYLKPPLEKFLRSHGLEWSDVVPVLEEVDSIDELKAAIDNPVAFLEKLSKAGNESLGILISASLHVLDVEPDGQGSGKGVQVGDIISRVGSTDLSFDGRTRLDMKAASLLSRARADGDAIVTIEFNGGMKSADFRIKSKLTAAVASSASAVKPAVAEGKSMIAKQAPGFEAETAQEKPGPEIFAQRTQAMAKSPADGNSAPLPDAASSVGAFLTNVHQEVIESETRGPSLGRYSEELFLLPSPMELTRRVISHGMSVEEQRQQERQNARTEAAAHAEAAAAAAIPTKDLEATLMQATILIQTGGVWYCSSNTFKRLFL